MIRRPPRSTLDRSSAASDVYKRQRYGIEVIPFGHYSDPRLVVELAQVAEAAGWEAITLWDHVLFPYGTGDPWVTLAAVAATTRTIKLCTDVSPLPRYAPHVLARTLVALDILSQGRVILGAGAGVDFDFTPVDPATSPKRRAVILDESLAILAHLLAGEAVPHPRQLFTFHHYNLLHGPVAGQRTSRWQCGAQCGARAARRRVRASVRARSGPVGLSCPTRAIWQWPSIKPGSSVTPRKSCAPGGSGRAAGRGRRQAMTPRSMWISCSPRTKRCPSKR